MINGDVKLSVQHRKIGASQNNAYLKQLILNSLSGTDYLEQLLFDKILEAIVRLPDSRMLT